MERIIKWHLGAAAMPVHCLSNEREAKVIISLTLEKTIWADGHIVPVSICEMEIIATVAGIEVGSGKPQTINPQQGCVAKIGKLGISAGNLDRINEAISEVEDTTAWREKIRRQEAARKADEEYEDHRRRMDAVMQAGGY